MAKDSAKAKDRGKDRDKERPKKARGEPKSAAGKATVASSMGAASAGPVADRAALPQTREELTDLWLEARRRRHTAQPGSEAYVQACEDVARIEVEIAAVERTLTPPLV